MKTLTSFFLLAIFSLAAFSQTPKCGLTLKDSPTVRGLKLGFPEAEFNKMFSDPFLIVDKRALTEKQGFENIDSIHFNFYKAKLMDFTILYDNSVTWNNAKEFADALSESLKLPKAAWVYTGTTGAMLDCTEFTVVADADKRWMQVSDKLATAALLKERKEEKQQKKKAFKP